MKVLTSNFRLVGFTEEVSAADLDGLWRARGIATAYGTLATGGEALGFKRETLDELMAPYAPPRQGEFDLVLREQRRHSLGFLRPSPATPFGSGPRAFGTPGAGGSFSFADPDLGLGYSYVMNKMGVPLFNDPREKAIRDACYRALKSCGGSPPLRQH